MGRKKYHIVDVRFNEQITYDFIYDAYIKSKSGKTSRTDVVKFHFKLEDYISYICKQLKDDSYSFGKYRVFYVYEPKKRKILAAPFIDRIVHTWYVENFLERYFVPDFISTSYACIKNKGMHECALKVKRDIYNIYRKNPNAYIIKMDVAKYFASINRELLFEIIENKISDKYFLRLTKKILDSTKEYDEEKQKGLPIGNFTSQMFGNIYLHQVDIYATKILNCKYYYRYMDDTCIIVEDKTQAKYILNKLIEFYEQVLNLKLNNKTEIFKIQQGLNFCGYKIKIGRMYLRNKGKRKIIKKLNYIRKKVRANEMTIEESVRQITGHVGYMKIADVDNIVKKYFYHQGAFNN